MKIEADNGKVYKCDKYKDPFYRFFLRNNCLRESCYNCPSRGLYKRADITLSDYWGVENTDSDLVDGGGISLVLLHSQKGRKAFDRIKGKCIGHQVEFDRAISGNQAFYASYDRPYERSLVEKEIDNVNFETLFWKYGMSWKGRIKTRILRVFGKETY